MSYGSLNSDKENQMYTEEVKNNNFHLYSAATYFHQGVEHYRLGDFQGAVEEFNRAIQINPNYADAYNKRSSAYASLGNYQKAIEDLQIATNLYLG